jgi:hypothetical protein
MKLGHRFSIARDGNDIAMRHPIDKPFPVVTKFVYCCLAHTLRVAPYEADVGRAIGTVFESPHLHHPCLICAMGGLIPGVVSQAGNRYRHRIQIGNLIKNRWIAGVERHTVGDGDGRDERVK